MTTRFVFALGLLAVLVLSGSACQGGSEPEGGGIGVSRQALGSSPDNRCSFGSSAGHDYWFCSTERNWQTARSKCQAIGMDLATIESSAENDFISSHVPDDSWIGANDIAVEGAWRWAQSGVQFWQGAENGSPVGGAYTNWKAGQPNNLGNQDCATIDDVIHGKWADEACSGSREYVCEGVVDLCPNDPNKTEPGQCGCGTPDTDTDGDRTADCHDGCPTDATKVAPGVCGCGVSDADPDADGVPNCQDKCPNDLTKIRPGDCGCSDAPAPVGTRCNDGLCTANSACDGTGVCGTPSSCPAPDTDCSYGVFRNVYYWSCNNDRAFTVARQRCTALGMDLPVIESAAEDSFLTSIIREHTFLGASDQAVEGEWRWLPAGTLFWKGNQNGSPVGGAYTNWEAGQPNDSLSDLDCIVKDPPIGGGKWETRLCTLGEAFACEAPPAKVRPLPPCIRPVTGGGYEALFGYENPFQEATEIPLGPDNSFAPPPTSRGQPERFLPGRISGAFAVRLRGDTLTWTLMGRSVTASPSSPACSDGACTGCGEGRSCLDGTCVASCGDGLCALAEDCRICPSDCGCPQGEVCDDSGGCGVPARCGMDWDCGSGSSFGVQVDCGGCPAGKTCVAHACL